jgi:AcrR family transcriptional regulator
VSLRDEHKELTRRKVVDAVLALVAEGSFDELSVPAVARRSGVSLATIYRYFPTKDELLVAAAMEPARQALTAEGSRQPGDDAFAAFQRSMWTSFASNLPLLRHQVTSEAGREMRDARLAHSRSQVADYITARGVDARSVEGERLIALLLLVSGSLGLVELHDRQGLSIDDALAVSLWAAEVLIAASRTPAAQPPAAQPSGGRRTADAPPLSSTKRKKTTR